MPATGVTLAGSAGSLNESLNTIISEFKILRDDTGVVRSSATQMTLKPHEGATKNVLNYNRVVAYGVSDGLDIAQAQQLTDSLTSFTPSEVAVQVVLGGRTMRRVADPNLLSQTGRILNNAYNLKEDQDGITQLASFTGSATLGAAGTVLSPGLIAAGAARLAVGDNRANPEPAPAPWYAIVHPYAALPLWGRMVPLATTPAGGTAYGVNTGAHVGTSVTLGINDHARLLKEGIGGIGTLAGVLVKQDANFSVDTNDDFTGAIFSKEGLIYVSEEEPRMDNDTSDKSMRGAVEVNVWGSYVFGNYRPANYGIPLTVDASTPTS